MLSKLAVKTRMPLTRTACRALAASSSSSHLLTTTRFQSTAAAVESTPSMKAPPTNNNTKQKKTPFQSTPERKYEYFQNVQLTDSGVAIIRFDCPGKSVNTISFHVATEANQLWQNEIANSNQVKAVVFTSAKPNMFIAGPIFTISSPSNTNQI